ncbi:MAG: RNA 2',3'-cyclic phosphodiesterase [Desulfovibrio sp.]|nr:RNA 2',3'-cyclic phosphodiesterase [Desulfovibrio sp.]
MPAQAKKLRPNRLFVAVETPAAIRSVLTELRLHFPGLQWTPPDKLHLTLRFIGLVPEAGTAAVQQALRGIRHGAFRLTVAGLGLFPRRTGGIVWAGIREEPALQKLKRQVDEALCDTAGLRLPDGPFSPHVTLTRLKKPPSSALKTLVREKSVERFGEMPVTAFTLFRSYLYRSGAIHEPLERYALTPEDPSLDE